MIISILVAMNEDLLIGVNNDLPWKLQDDLEHFKNYSLNKPIIMGRKTFESIGRPLPNRKNLIVSNTLNEITKRHTSSWWLTELEKQKIGCGPINTLSQVFSDPPVSYTHLRAHET